jgi:hypothetical protein
MGVAMVLRSAITTGEKPEPIVQTAGGKSSPVGASAATVLLLATWVGLVAGWVDLGLMAVNRRLIHGDFYRLGEACLLLAPMRRRAGILSCRCNASVTRFWGHRMLTGRDRGRWVNNYRTR